jgi:ABC-type polysaccharide/polyol phosphate export permease
VFFRDLGNILRHFLRLWFYLSPALYSLSVLDSSEVFQQNPLLRTLAHANPFGVLFEAYRAVIYGTPDGPPHAPDWLPLLLLFGASLLLVAFGAVVFKRLEPTFAKVL